MPDMIETAVYYLKLIAKRVVFLSQYVMGHKFVEYHHFPFNTLDVRLKDEDAQELHEVSQELERLSFRFRVTDGTALGMYRDGHFIRHDNDLDFDLLGELDIRPLRQIMKKRGYKIGRLVFFNKAIQQVVFFNKSKVIVDFLVWHKVEEGLIENYEERGYVRVQSIKYFQELTDFCCYGYSFKFPGYMEEWLIKRYGSDWNIPKTYKGDWKEECPDLKRL